MPSDTYVVQLGCANCGLLSSHEIPTYREIVTFEQYWADDTTAPDGVSRRKELSRTQRPNGTDLRPLICPRCKLPHLVAAFYGPTTDRPAGLNESSDVTHD